MPQDHSLQPQRFELKYFLREEVAVAVRHFVNSYLELDEYAAKQPDGSYTIHTLYLDSPGLETHYASVNGHRNRFKLRLRYYDDAPDATIFCEIKRRSDNCVLKERCGVRREALPQILAGQTPDPARVLARKPRDRFALQNFSRLLLLLNASPRAHNVYRREVWVSARDNSVRISFDREVRLEPCFEARPVVKLARPARLYPGLVVLELKFTNRCPEWCRALVRNFELMQASVGKYSDGIAVFGESRFHGERPGPQPGPAMSPAWGNTDRRGAGIALTTHPEAGHE